MAAASLTAACSGSNGGAPTGPSAAETRAFSYATNLIPVEITVGSATGMAIVDTGNPFVLLDPTTFTSATNLPANGGDVPSIGIESVVAKNAYVIPTADGLTSPDPSFPLAANLGWAGIGAFVASFNYRDVAFTLGAELPTPPTGLLPDDAVAFSFEGGSQLDGIAVPRSRIVVTVTIEGNPYRMMVDTGATYVTVSSAAFATITSDGRTQISGGNVETTAGESTTALSRVASIGIGTAQVDSVVIASDPAFDTNLTAISTDVGETIDGSLGGTYLHDFFMTVDYPNSELHLARYANTDFALDPAERLGLQLAVADGTYGVASATGDAATKGVTAGDEIVAIDGTALDGLSVSEAGILIFGKVGTTKSVTFGAATHLANQTVALAVEELLPLPAAKQ